ncbi:hypothetical protein C2845_PM13G03450 [Panicum miliaceum]|uniref:Uncharacterized protein n=1 Tax=Panicum miliaceum TaxID=4540 RepID=A0A3L6RHG6_PANMI|nr:hypothetical protein C2845_PM13G03450 [Panicum miliaceum]
MGAQKKTKRNSPNQMLLLGRPPAYQNIPGVKGGCERGAQVPGPQNRKGREKEMKILRSIRPSPEWTRWWTGRTLMRAALHHGCVSRRLSHSAATYDGIRVSLSRHLVMAGGSSDRRAFGTGHVGRRRAGLSMADWAAGAHAAAALSGRRPASCAWIRCRGPGDRSSSPSIPSRRLPLQYNLAMHGCLFW